MKKSFVFLMVSTMFLILAACSEINDEEVGKEIQDKETAVDPDENIHKDEIEELSQPIEVADLGKMIPVGIGFNNDLGIDGTDKPLQPAVFDSYNVFIESLMIMDVELSGEGMANFNHAGNLKMVIVQSRVSADKDKTSEVSYDLGEMGIMVEDKLIYSEPAYTDPWLVAKQGESSESGKVAFFIKDVEKIESINLIIPSEIGSPNPDQKEYKIDVSSIKEAYSKDNS